MVLDNGLDARHEGLVHWAVGVVLGTAARKRAVERPTHDGLLTKCLEQSWQRCETRNRQTQSFGAALFISA